MNGSLLQNPNSESMESEVSSTVRYLTYQQFVGSLLRQKHYNEGDA